MKKFFHDSCIINASGIAAFAMVAISLFIVWHLISSGVFVAQILAIAWVLYFGCSALIGAVIILVDLIRRIVAKVKNESAPTEVSAK